MPEFSTKAAEFWLPPQFPSDRDVIPTVSNVAGCSKKLSGTPYGGHVQGVFANKGFFRSSYDFEPFGFSPDMISPLDSVFECDEEDYLAGLTRQMAHATLDDCPQRKPYYDYSSDNTKAWVMSGSPPSTLCGGAMGCGCSIHSSSRGSPDGFSPPTVPAPSATTTTWDLLSAAAAEVSKIPFTESGRYSHAFLSRERQMKLQILKMKEEYVRNQLSKLAWESSQSKAGAGMNRQMGVQSTVGGGYDLNRNGRPIGITWPPLQAQPVLQQQQQRKSSAMKAVFLGSNGAKKECAGTGVFLPRRADYPAEPRKKSGCSTVLVPARVAQALNLKLEDMGGAQYQLQSRSSGSFFSDGEIGALRPGNTTGGAAQKHYNVRPQPATNQEIRLPQEWTY